MPFLKLLHCPSRTPSAALHCEFLQAKKYGPTADDLLVFLFLIVWRENEKQWGHDSWKTYCTLCLRARHTPIAWTSNLLGLLWHSRSQRLRWDLGMNYRRSLCSYRRSSWEEEQALGELTMNLGNNVIWEDEKEVQDTYKLAWPTITIALESGAARSARRRLEICMMRESNAGRTTVDGVEETAGDALIKKCQEFLCHF